MKVPRIYLDSSVIGGCFDSEFELYSQMLMDEFKQGKKCALISKVLIAEIQDADLYVTIGKVNRSLISGEDFRSIKLPPR